MEISATDLNDIGSMLPDLPEAEALFPTDVLWVVEVSGIEHGGLVWRPHKSAERKAADAQRLLIDFARLALAEEAEILAFARKWGPLGLCKAHGWSMCHRDHLDLPDGRVVVKWKPEQLPEPLGLVCPPISRKVRADSYYLESVERWQRYAKHLAATLILAARLRQGQAISSEILEFLGPPDETERRADLCLGAAVSFWSSPLMADLRPRVAVASSGGPLRLWLVGGSSTFVTHGVGRLSPVMGFSTGLLGVLALQLALVVTGGAGYAVCAGCGTLYKPKRRPADGRNHFCSGCGKKASRRLAKRRERKENA
jgi:hypothetical protein